MSRPTKANLKANCAGLQAEPQAQRFSREMRPRRRRRVARGEAEPRSGRKRPRDSATHCRRQPKTSLRPPCALSVANQLCLATKGAQRGTKVFRVGAPPQVSAPTPSGLSVLPPDHLRVLPPDPRRVLPGGGVGVLPVHPLRVLPLGGVGVLPSDPKGVVPKSASGRLSIWASGRLSIWASGLVSI